MRRRRRNPLQGLEKLVNDGDEGDELSLARTLKLGLHKVFRSLRTLP